MFSFFRFIVIYYIIFASSSSNAVLAKEENARARPTYVTPTELKLFRSSLEFIQDNNCRRDLNATLWGLTTSAQWAVLMYDASVRNPVGIGSAVMYQFGHYDQCMYSRFDNTEQRTATDAPHPIQVQYCLVDVELSGILPREPVLEPKSSTLTTHWGECVPAACSDADVAIYLQHILQRNVTVNGKMCQLSSGQSKPITTGMFIYALIIAIFLLLTVLSTGYHIYLRVSEQKEDEMKKTLKRNELVTLALLSFSIIENAKKIFQASRDKDGLSAINGLKGGLMFLILWGHAALFSYGVPLYNTDFYNQVMRTPYVGFLTNSLLCVDTFLLMSGYLLFRIMFPILERRRGKLNPLIVYFGRYIRLTPAYIVVIGFYMTWFPRMSDGPLWQERIEREQERCQTSWWLNLLYVNNYFNSDKLCMFQSWYLSADTQLFVVAPLILMVMYKSRKLGIRLLMGLVVMTSIIPFVLTYIQELPPTFIMDINNAKDVTSDTYYNSAYIKTHMRASAYFMGLLSGYVVHKMNTKGTKLPKYLSAMLWTLGLLAGGASMFTHFRFYKYPYTNIESTMYAGFHRLAWNLSNAWLVIAVTTNHGGWLQRVLSARIFVPFSRLAYCAFLVNGLVVLHDSSIVRTLDYVDIVIAEDKLVSQTIDTFLLAFVICLLFESPIHVLERILMKKYAHGDNGTPKGNRTAEVSPATSEEQVA